MRREQIRKSFCVALVAAGILGSLAAVSTSGGSSLSDQDQASLQQAQVADNYIYNHSNGTIRSQAGIIRTDLANVLTPVAASTTTTTAVATTTTAAPTTTVPVTTTTLPPSACTATISPGTSISAAATGGTLCLASGVYNQIVNITHSGTVQAAPGATPIIDGTGIVLSKTSDLVHLSASNVNFGLGVEVRNISGRAITMTGTGDVVEGATVHDGQYNGILAAGTGQTIRDNTVYRTVLSNTNAALGSSGWAEAVNTWQATNTTIVNNYIHDNWGEGIDFITSNGGTVTGNTIVNNFSVLIYIGGGDSNITIDHNTLSVTVPTYNRSYGVWGILLSSEGGTFDDAISITNNAYHGTAPAGQPYSTWNVTPTNFTVSGNTFF